MKTIDSNGVRMSGQLSIALRSGLMCVALSCASAPAWAEDMWLVCDGSVVTTPSKGTATTATASDIYAYNDELKFLYKYSPERQNLAIVPVATYSAKEIVWGRDNQGVAASWEGRLDRATMALKIVRSEAGDTMTWTERCKPTSAQPLK